MSVLSFEAHEPVVARAPVSGGAMDRAVVRKTIDRRLLGGGIAVVVALLGVLFYLYAPRSGSQSVAADRVTISPVTKGVFEDFLPLRARATPLVTVFLDAVEGGRIDRLLVEDGATVTKGELLAEMSNADLQLSTLARQTEVEQQLNNMRSQELALAQSRLNNERDIVAAELDAHKAQRQFDMQKPLAERGFVAGKAFRDTTDELAYQNKRGEVLRRAQATEERLQTSQLAQLRAASLALRDSLGVARASLDQLKLRAPVSGQLTSFSIQLGQSMKQGERLGQIDSPGRNKLVADVDEFYLGRVVPGQAATLDQGGKVYSLKISKIYPQVKSGTFIVDLVFTGPEPANLQRGQTLQARLTLSDPAPARLVPNGSWYNDTGGNWMFVIAPDGGSAVRRNVSLGRRNADFVEVLDGLDAGERVLTSPYTGLVDKDRLSFEPAN